MTSTTRRPDKGPIRILHVSTYDGSGGAARAAVRLHDGLRRAGVASRMLVQRKSGDDPAIESATSIVGKMSALMRPRLDVLTVRAFSTRQPHSFTAAMVPGGLNPEGIDDPPDVIHLHWIGAGAMSIERIGRIRKPVVWTLHDSWAFTGGCHVPFECSRYRELCGHCPALGSSREADLSRWIWRRKLSSWADLNLTLAAPSRWLADCARSSSLFHDRVRIVVIPHGIDLERYRPVDKVVARQLLGLPEDRKLLLFGSIGPTSDENKGFRLLAEALDGLGAKGREGLDLAIFGASAASGASGLAMPTHHLGFLHDDVSLSLAYSAADVMVVPSIQEAFGQTALEAQACGTPVVAFGATGLLDVVEHETTGYLARPYDAQDLAHGIEWVLDNAQRWAELSRAARAKTEREFSICTTAARYLDLYRELQPAGGTGAP